MIDCLSHPKNNEKDDSSVTHKYMETNPNENPSQPGQAKVASTMDANKESKRLEKESLEEERKERGRSMDSYVEASSRIGEEGPSSSLVHTWFVLFFE